MNTFTDQHYWPENFLTKILVPLHVPRALDLTVLTGKACPDNANLGGG